MDYLPVTLYLQPQSANFYWGTIDEAIRTVAYRYVSRTTLTLAHTHFTFNMSGSPCGAAAAKCAYWCRTGTTRTR